MYGGVSPQKFVLFHASGTSDFAVIVTFWPTVLDSEMLRNTNMSHDKLMSTLVSTKFIVSLHFYFSASILPWNDTNLRRYRTVACNRSRCPLDPDMALHKCNTRRRNSDCTYSPRSPSPWSVKRTFNE